jgi:hypothetical protein
MAKTKGEGKVPVSTRALLARLNRKLRHEDLMVKTCAPYRRGYDELGDFYVVNTNRNWIAEKNIDLEDFAREYEVLKPWEKLVEEEED